MKLDCVHFNAGRSYLEPSKPIRMRRSPLQWVMSASHASCSDWLHGFDPPSHSPFIVRHSGAGICWPLGEKCVSWAEQTTLTASKIVATSGSGDFTVYLLEVSGFR